MSLKITELIIHDFKRIRAVVIDPKTGKEKKPTVLTGDNGAGKSAILDALEWALKRTGTEQPVRRGAKKAIVEMTISNEKRKFSLRRSETTKGSHNLSVLSIESEDKKPVPSPQKFLSGLTASNIAFDPLEFLRMRPAERIEALREALNLDVSDLDAKEKEAYEERTLVNRDGKSLKERFSALPVPAQDAPTEEVKASDVVEKRDELKAQLDRVEELAGEAQEAKNAVAETEAEIKELRAKLTDQKAALTSANKAFTQANKAAPDPRELEKLEAEISDIDTRNAQARDATQYHKLKAELEAKRKESAGLSAKIDDLQAEKRKRVEEAAFPVEGMEILEDDVYVDGVPFTQLSTGQQIIVSAEVAMSENAELPLVLVREGALINKANLKLLFDSVNKRGFNLFIEKFQEEPGDEGLHIEDGSVIYEDGKKVEKPVPEPPEEDEEPEATAAEAEPPKEKEKAEDKGADMDAALGL